MNTDNHQFFDGTKLLEVLQEISIFGYQISHSILSIMSVSQYSKNRILKPVTTQLDKVYFVNSGLVEAYTVGESGKIHVHRIYRPGEFIFDPSFIFDGQDSSFILRAISNCELGEFSIDSLKNLYNMHSEIGFHFMQIVLNELKTSQKKQRDQMEKDAGQRYLSFLEDYKGYLEQISNKKLSQYLGITEQGLHKAKSKL